MTDSLWKKLENRPSSQGNFIDSLKNGRGLKGFKHLVEKIKTQDKDSMRKSGSDLENGQSSLDIDREKIFIMLYEVFLIWNSPVIYCCVLLSSGGIGFGISWSCPCHLCLITKKSSILSLCLEAWLQLILKVIPRERYSILTRLKWDTMN